MTYKARWTEKIKKSCRRMKNKWNIFMVFLIISLVGYSNESFKQNTNIGSDTETLNSNIEKQLQVILDKNDWNYPQSDYVCHKFAITDLDQNGRLELIISQLEGSGRYTYSEYYEVNKNLDGLTPCKWLSRESDSEADIMVDCVPAYYDSHNKIYYYIFNDLIKDGIHYNYINKRAVSFADGKLSERILAYKNTYKKDSSNSSASISYEDADGNEIDKKEYDMIDETVFEDFIKKEAHFSWFDLNDRNLGEKEISVILQKSWDGFLIQ